MVEKGAGIHRVVRPKMPAASGAPRRAFNMALHNQEVPVLQQPRRPRGSYKASLATRAVAAAVMAEQQGWPTKEVASLFAVCRAYVDLARGADEDTRNKLLAGAITLAQLHRNRAHRRAERWAQQQAETERQEAEQAAAEREALARAEHEAQTRQIDMLIDDVGFNHVIDRLVDRLGAEFSIDALDVSLRRHGCDTIRVILDFFGPNTLMAAIDAATAPVRVAAE
jgi:hypothetical protein